MEQMKAKPFRLGVAGAGKIVRDQHVDAIRATEGLELVASADPHSRLEDVASYASLEEMLDAEPDIDAVAICTPAHLRHRLASQALARGKAVLLEKPPGATLAEVQDLKAQAEKAGLTLFAAWHSRFAPGIAAAADWLAGRRVEGVDIRWHEDVRVWHPGQAWLWEAGGMGVFDPGINALSIVTALLPDPFFLKRANLVVPANAQTPIAATLEWRTADGVLLSGDFDFRHEDPPCWEMTFVTDGGSLTLEAGGARLIVDGKTLIDEPEREYQGVYAHFHSLLEAGQRDMDITPLQQVADALMLGHRQTTEAFVDDDGSA
ncbi:MULTISPECIES: Gfo/Idh/MocA family oxidoreductase [unclassified Halomonas]|nr:MULTISPECIES: Gfo/Idh/MocA family oxidoreductase [unclassified Halomonas]MCJ8287476.1 Gfo/Idh/MocA family oxidoreductase [Halomonas sp.]MCO7217281.1 Gfo/Idh/MocA family oxidoreductase [Halomonas sp. OfavH-34-E]